MAIEQFSYSYIKPEPVLVSSETKKKAIRALLGDAVEPDVFEKLSDYIESEYSKTNCCVIYAVNEKCRELLDSLHLDIGKKEVVINDHEVVLFSDNFRFYPTVI